MIEEELKETEKTNPETPVTTDTDTSNDADASKKKEEPKPTTSTEPASEPIKPFKRK